MADCVVAKENMGLSKCNKFPALIKGIITTPDTFFLSPANAALQASWQAAIEDVAAERIYLWPWFVSMENLSEDAVYEETPLAYILVRDGNYRFKFHIKENLCVHRAMFTHRSNQGRVFLIDTDNNIIGKLNEAGTEFKGFSIQLLNTEKLLFSDGGVSSKSPILVALKNNKEMDKDGYIVTLDEVNDLVRPVDVTITINTQTTSSIVATVTVTCDGTKVNGLVQADFKLLNGAGAAQAIDSVTEVDGVYTFTPDTTFADGILGLQLAASLTTDPYECDAATVNVP
jgi:hypothetical protein